MPRARSTKSTRKQKKNSGRTRTAEVAADKPLAKLTEEDGRI